MQGESGDSEVENKLKMQIQIPKNTYFGQFPSSISQKLPLAIDKFWNTDLDRKHYFEECLRFVYSIDKV